MALLASRSAGGLPRRRGAFPPEGRVDLRPAEPGKPKRPFGGSLTAPRRSRPEALGSCGRNEPSFGGRTASVRLNRKLFGCECTTRGRRSPEAGHRSSAANAPCIRSESDLQEFTQSRLSAGGRTCIRKSIVSLVILKYEMERFII